MAEATERALSSLFYLFHSPRPGCFDISEVLVLAEMSQTSLLGAVGSPLIFHCHASKLIPGGAVKLRWGVFMSQWLASGFKITCSLLLLPFEALLPHPATTVNVLLRSQRGSRLF